MQYLLDTDTCVDLLRGVRAVVAKMGMLTSDDCGISAVTGFELFAGAEKAREPQREIEKINALLEIVEQLPFSSEAARRAGGLRAGLEKAGTPGGAYDLLIAAQALTAGLTLVTANTAEFSRVAGLRLENWR